MLPAYKSSRKQYIFGVTACKDIDWLTQQFSPARKFENSFQ